MTNAMTPDQISGPINITGNQNSFTITGCCGGGGGMSCLTWIAITANTTLASGHGYIVESGALSLALPATSSVGDIIIVTLAGGGTSWTITQAAGQQIMLGSYETTAGISGSLASTALGDSVSLVCTVANTSWMSYATQGNILIN